MLSNKCKYAIRAVLFLAVESSWEKRVSGNKVSEALSTPNAFTVKILQELARKNIIISVKGPKGGFCISEECLNLPLLQIVDSIDSLSFFQSCGLGLHECSEEHPCPIHHSFKISRDEIQSLFQTKTIKEVAFEVMNSGVFLVDN